MLSLTQKLLRSTCFPLIYFGILFTSFTSLESQIAKLKRNQERRIDRKNKKIAKEGGEPLLTAPVVKSETSRKCGNCGEMGHMSMPKFWYHFPTGN